jgi:hypothetical protein
MLGIQHSAYCNDFGKSQRLPLEAPIIRTEQNRTEQNRTEQNR